jgi:E3 ubiquitin-protein ligase DOA10
MDAEMMRAGACSTGPVSPKDAPEDDQARPTPEEAEIGSSATPEEEEERCCRICYDDEDEGDPDSTLLSVCACRGSSGLVHMACLKEWHAHEGYPEQPQCGLCGEHYTGADPPPISTPRNLPWIGR